MSDKDTIDDLIDDAELSLGNAETRNFGDPSGEVALRFAVTQAKVAQVKLLRKIEFHLATIAGALSNRS